jgi:hypothetical protein
LPVREYCGAESLTQPARAKEVAAARRARFMPAI